MRRYDRVTYYRRELARYDCQGRGCPDLASVEVRYQYTDAHGRPHVVRKYYCPPHARAWRARHAPPEQLTLF